MLITTRRYFTLIKELKNFHKFASTTAAVQPNGKPCHIPVMKFEVMEHLCLKDGDTILDMTFGGGGHSRYLLENYPNLKIIALDRDPLAYGYAKELQKELPNQITPLFGKFSELCELVKENNIKFQSVDGVICDLGASSMQMDLPERGFALSQCGPLDMRMDGNTCEDTITAADVVNYATEDELYKIFKIYGQERHSRIIARSLVQVRATYQKLNTTSDLADLVQLACSKPRYDKLERRAHSATKIFQALRIFVNDELNELNIGLLQANFMLKMNGRITVLSFHSLEDTLVKRHFQGHIFDNAPTPVEHRLRNANLDMSKEMEYLTQNIWSPINKKVIVPTDDEVNFNPRSRSAKLRAATKIGHIKWK